MNKVHVYTILVTITMPALLQPAYSGKPKILEQGSFTKAAPSKEQKHFRHVSDSIGNNYSPQARHLTTSYIYDTTRFCK